MFLSHPKIRADSLTLWLTFHTQEQERKYMYNKARIETMRPKKNKANQFFSPRNLGVL